MAYIGNKPTVGNFQICDAISVVNGQAAYTMQVGSVNVIPQSANHMIVSLNSCIQNPNSSFTVSGSTITFSSNLVTGDVIDFIQILGDVLDLGVPSDATVTTAKVVDGAITSAKLASGVGGVAGITSSADATAISIDSSEVVRLPVGVLRLQNSTTGTADTDGLLIEASGNDVYINNKENADMYFRTNNTNRMLINSSGNVYVATTSESSNTVGGRFFATGLGAFTVDGSQCLTLNRLSSDGELQRFKQASTTEGNISVSGSTVSYNGFTGTHWSRFQDNSTPTILRGTVLETLDEMCNWYNLEFDVITQDENGNDVTTPQKIPHVLLDSQSDGDTITYNHKGTDVQATIVKEVDVKHMMSKVSDTTDAKNVYGLFVAYDLDGEGYNDFYVASVGSYVVRIKQGETIAKGDLLQSNGDGTAKVQTDDNIKSSSFAKVLSTTKIETYEDGSFIVPCSLMC